MKILLQEVHMDFSHQQIKVIFKMRTTALCIITIVLSYLTIEDLQVSLFFSSFLTFENRLIKEKSNILLDMSNNRDNSDSKISRSTFGKSKTRRFAPAGTEDDDYDALFGSDEEQSKDYKINSDSRNMNSAFPAASTWNTNNSDTTKRVDWAKMRLADTTNDMTKWKDFPPVVKEFYKELLDIAQMSSEDVQALRAEKNNIVVSWFDSSMKDNQEKERNCKLSIPNPVYEFAHAFHNYPDIMNEIYKQGFTEPSPIQCQAWPVALQGHDFIGIAQVEIYEMIIYLYTCVCVHIDFRLVQEKRLHFFCQPSFI